MSRRDPGAANGGIATEPGRCVCGVLEPLHILTRPGQRGGFRQSGCKQYEPASNVIAFPGVGPTPAPGPRPAPADLDAMGERYVAYCEARDGGRPHDMALLAAACAEDVAAWRDEVHRLELLRRELAAELDRLTGGA